MSSYYLTIVTGTTSVIPYEIYKLVKENDKILKTPTQPFDFSNQPISAVYLASSLFKTMFEGGGLGLAANQCGIGLSVFVCGIEEANKQVFFNPEIIETSEEYVSGPEGCLSARFLFLKVERPKWIRVKYQHVTGEWKEGKYEGMTARVIHHEIDHLKGKFFTSYVGKVTLAKAREDRRKMLKKLERAK